MDASCSTRIAGSTVEPDRLRFDFTYGKQLTSQQLKDIEEWVNKAAQRDLATSVKVQQKAYALKVSVLIQRTAHETI